MNLLKLAAIVALSSTITSCRLAYQVFTVQPAEKTMMDSAFVYTNDDVAIGYHLWANGGVMDYYVHNKTDKPIYINWDRSHFILNKLSRDYYGKNQDCVYDNLTEVVKTKKVKAAKPAKSEKVDSTATKAVASVTDTAAAKPVKAKKVKAAKNKSDSTAAATTEPAKKSGIKKNSRNLVYSGSVQHSNQISARSKSVVEIPPHARVLSSDFTFVTDVQNDKKLKLGLFRSKRSLLYDAENSPYKFRNYITYSFTNNFTAAKVIDNEFYVSEITSLSRGKFLGQKVRAKRITSSLNKKQFLFDLPYFNNAAFFIRNPEFIKLGK